MLIESLFWLVFAMQMDWQAAIATKEDVENITFLAANSLPYPLSTRDFESMEITKSTYDYWDRDNVTLARRTEHVRLRGQFPLKIDQPGYRVQDLIRCDVKSFYKDGVLEKAEEHCVLSEERLLRYPGISQEVKIGGSVSVETARLYLEFLTGPIARPVIEIRHADDYFFTRINIVRGTMLEGFLEIDAGMQGDCRYIGLKARYEPDSEVQFKYLRWDGSIC